MAQTSTGVVISISAGIPATQDKVGYEALTFTEITGVTSIGEYGAQVGVVNYTPLKDGITRKEKGFTNYGTLSMQLVHEAGDAGQALVKTASTSSADYSFSIEYDDGSVDYFMGIVTSFTKNVVGEAMVDGTAAIEIKSAIVEVAA